MELENSIKKLVSVNQKLAKLKIEQESLTDEIIKLLKHDHNGQRSYEYKQWKIECKTPSIYSLNTKAYINGDYYIPDGFNPIKEKMTYTVDKKMCDLYLSTGPKDAREALRNLIEIKPGKPGVAIKDNL